ncbi:hypothetical protein [Cryobacterium sp. M23]|nr:hypothetical protein [Cryobacterium sp. M23]
MFGFRARRLGAPFGIWPAAIGAAALMFGLLNTLPLPLNCLGA